VPLLTNEEIIMGYIANFIVYTLAMTGVIAVALLVFKNATAVNCGAKSKHLRVLDTLSIAPRKTLYVVSAGREKFLIAGDVDKTTLISKLEGSEDNIEELKTEEIKTPRLKEAPTFRQTMENLPKPSFMDKSNIGITSSLLSQNKGSVLKSLAERIK